MKKFFAVILISVFFMAIAVTLAYSAVRNQNGSYYIDGIEGSAQILDNKSEARENAKLMAYVNAVDKVIRFVVPGITERNSYRSIKDNIYSKASGLIKNFKISSENIEGDMLYITASCTIAEKAFDSILGSEVIAIMGTPRILAVVEQSGNDKNKKPYELQLQAIFEKAGYSVPSSSNMNIDTSDTYDNPDKLINAARRLKADIIVIARTSAGSSSTTRYSVKMYKSSGSVRLKAIQTSTGRELASASYSNSTGWSGSTASGGIISTGIKRTAEDIIYKMAFNSVSAGSSSGGITRVSVNITNASFSYVERIEAKFREWLNSDGDVEEKAYDKGTLELDIVSDKTEREIASFLSGYAEITGRAQGTVIAKAGVINDNKPIVKPTMKAVEISIIIDNIRSRKEAEELEALLSKFIGSSGQVNNIYSNPTANMTVIYSGNTGMKTTEEISLFLKEQDINIDSYDGYSVKGWKKGGGWLW